ncbi:MAG TPA: hypothetical protein VJL58_02035 [Pyrinomonadaceae bacterium]|nr:hypothetical protein [Pyrinomonadaceae bacterium]
MKREKYLNYLGWFGGAVCLAAYGLNVQHILSSASLVFLIMNTFGCCCLIYYTFCKSAFANTALNSVYLFITLLAIAKYFL